MKEVDDILYNIIFENSPGTLRLNLAEEEMKTAYNQFITKEIDEVTLKKRLIILQPLMEQRKRYNKK